MPRPMVANDATLLNIVCIVREVVQRVKNALYYVQSFLEVSEPNFTSVKYVTCSSKQNECKTIQFVFIRKQQQPK